MAAGGAKTTGAEEVCVDARQEVPVKSFSISACVCRVVCGRGRYLMIRRSTPYLKGIWQMVSGAVEAGETGWEAALREIEEEIGLVPDRFYSADILEQFYRPDIDCVVLVPVFVGFLEADRAVQLSWEHDAFEWIGVEEADRYLLFENQRSAIRDIERRFVQEAPNELLRIDTDRAE
jgi:dihydroneopterin triphosphate diphosphatase